jgi:hypothetical protein
MGRGLRNGERGGSGEAKNRHRACLGGLRCSSEGK